MLIFCCHNHTSSQHQIKDTTKGRSTNIFFPAKTTCKSHFVLSLIGNIFMENKAYFGCLQRFCYQKEVTSPSSGSVFAVSLIKLPAKLV